MVPITGLRSRDAVIGANERRLPDERNGDAMTMDAPPPEATGTDAADSAGSANRRRVLMLGAAGVAATLTVRPAFAQTAVSVLNCEIPVPAPTSAGQYIAADGSLVAPGTAGAFPPAHRPFRGEDVKAALQGHTLPGTSYEQNQAYLNYIRRLRAGQSGFTCFASIQMPR
jgi:hypothetical protein